VEKPDLRPRPSLRLVDQHRCSPVKQMCQRSYVAFVLSRCDMKYLTLSLYKDYFIDNARCLQRSATFWCRPNNTKVDALMIVSGGIMRCSSDSMRQRNSGVTAPNLVIFVGKIHQFNVLLTCPSAFRHFSPCRNTNNGIGRPTLPLKLVAIAKWMQDLLSPLVKIDPAITCLVSRPLK